MSWAVVTKEAETWHRVPTPGQVVFDPAVFDNRPVYDTGVQVPPWQAVATDTETWAIAAGNAETWTAKAKDAESWVAV